MKFDLKSIREAMEGVGFTMHPGRYSAPALPQTPIQRDPLVTVLNEMLQGTDLKIVKRVTAEGDASFDHPRKFIVETTGKASGDALEIASKITAFKTTLGIHGMQTNQELSPELGKSFSITLSRKDFDKFEHRADITEKMKKATAPVNEKA